AYVFESGGEFSVLHQLVNPEPGHGFGRSVAFLGTNFVVGGSGDVFVFDGESGGRILTISNPDRSSVFPSLGPALATSGTRLLVGAPNAGSFLEGAAYVFDAGGSLLLLLKNPGTVEGVSDNNFGSSVVFVGSDLLVGAPGN